MVKLSLIVFAIFSLLGSCGKGIDPPTPSVKRGAIIFEGPNSRYIPSETAITVGNRSYIPLNIPGKPEEINHEILIVLKTFEEERHVTITDWKIEKEQSATNAPEFIFGLWVDHTPSRKP